MLLLMTVALLLSLVSAILDVNYHSQVRDKLGGSFIHDFVQGRIDISICFFVSIRQFQCNQTCRLLH